MFPDSGGQYIFLREAYGDLVAFLYGWMLFAVANGGSIAALSVASAAYLGQVIPFVSQGHVALLAVRHGNNARPSPRFGIDCHPHLGQRRWPALGGIAAERFHVDEVYGDVRVRFTGIRYRKGKLGELPYKRRFFERRISMGGLISALGVGLIASFGPTTDGSTSRWVAGEVKDPRRNVPLAMVLGVLAVGAIYIAMNVTYLYAMPVNEIAAHETIAHAAAAALFSPAPPSGCRW